MASNSGEGYTANAERVRQTLELRRSNAAVPVRNRKRYRRNDWRRSLQTGRDA